MKSGLKTTLALSALLASVSCSSPEAESAQTPENSAPSSPEGTLAMSSSPETAAPAAPGVAVEAEATTDSAAAETEPQLDAFGRHSIYTGVYSEEQAARGQAIQQKECSACHNPDDWGEGNVLTGFTGMSAYDLVERLRTTMPMDEPGRLSLQQYTDVAAFIFQLNGAPPGSSELSADPAELARIRLEYRR